MNQIFTVKIVVYEFLLKIYQKFPKVINYFKFPLAFTNIYTAFAIIQYLTF